MFSGIHGGEGMMNEVVTIVCLTVITGLAMWLIPDQSKEITIATSAGLVGYLARGNKDKIKAAFTGSQSKQDQTNEKS